MVANDALAYKMQADLLVERTAMQLRALLQEAAGRLRPFPPFPGAFFTNAIEVDPGEGGRADLGCVVVCEDGELYELKMSYDFQHEQVDPVAARDEKCEKLQDLHPLDYVLYAYTALARITEALAERADQAAG